MPKLIERAYTQAVDPSEQHIMAGGEVLFASVGPLYLPAGVHVQTNGAGECLFRFAYPNEEERESRSRSIAGGSMRVVLGKHSRKILELEVPNALAQLGSGGPRFDPNESAVWCEDLRADRHFACKRNAFVVSKVVELMPDEIRESMIRALSGENTAEHRLG